MLQQPILERKYFNNPQQLNVNNYLIKGYASIFNIVDNHNDLIIPGAFDESITRHNNDLTVKLLWQHNHQEPIGIIETLHTDNIGLVMSASINEYTQRGREVISLLNQKAINGLSIGFKVEDHHYQADGVRIITKASLWEISVVTFPANEQAQITILDGKNDYLKPFKTVKTLLPLTNMLKINNDFNSKLSYALNNIIKLNNF